ncbi:MAG: EVE domain-containing protein [Gemmatimonadaceae bacterium]|nr:EVE domain-containing protein [Gloeobacterales cyanobacterium ES-bin-141]
MAYWLFKSEPSAFSFADLEAGPTEWSGVRNYQARNYMMAMQTWDLGYFYHSRTEPIGIVGIVMIVRSAYPDYTALDPTSQYHDPRATPQKPIWQMVDIAFKMAFSQVVTLGRLRVTPGLEGMALLQKGSRLSVQPVTSGEWEIIHRLATALP